MTYPTYSPPLGADIPVEPGFTDRVAAAVLRLALADANAGSAAAAAWLATTGEAWAESLVPGRGGPLVRDVLCELERRGEGAYRRMM